MATTPAEPGGSAAPIFSARPLSTQCLANLPIRHRVLHAPGSRRAAKSRPARRRPVTRRARYLVTPRLICAAFDKGVLVRQCGLVYIYSRLLLQTLAVRCTPPG